MGSGKYRQKDFNSGKINQNLILGMQIRKAFNLKVDCGCLHKTALVYCIFLCERGINSCRLQFFKARHRNNIDTHIMS